MRKRGRGAIMRGRTQTAAELRAALLLPPLRRSAGAALTLDGPPRSPPSPSQAAYDIKDDCGEVLFTREQVQQATADLGRRVGRPTAAAHARSAAVTAAELPPKCSAPSSLPTSSKSHTPTNHPTPPSSPQIARDYAHKSPLIVPILKGSFIFAADLVRALDPCPEHMAVEFVSARSYGAGFETSGEVQVAFDAAAVKGRHCVMVDDL
jgi:hypothetical protein